MIPIDGLQRISSYFHFRGGLELETNDRSIKKGDSLILTDCDIVPELNGLSHDDLPSAMQIRLKRHFIRVEVVRKESDQRLRYHMFKRLNTGGENLSEQEIRNCTVRLLDGGTRFMKFLIDLAATDDFRTCTQNISEESRQQRFDQELVLRFFAFKNWREKYRHDVADFLTDYMEAISDPAISLSFDYDAEKAEFLKTFKILAKTLEDKAFGWMNKSGTIVRGFSVYNFEAFTLGLQQSLASIDMDDLTAIETLRNVFEGVKSHKEFLDLTTGGGRNSRGALARRVSFVEEKLKQAL